MTAKMKAYERRDIRPRLSPYQIDLICEVIKDYPAARYRSMAVDRRAAIKEICGILRKTPKTHDKRR